MCGSDTFTTVVSSTTMNVPNITAIADEPRIDVPLGRGGRGGHRLAHRV